MVVQCLGKAKVVGSFPTVSSDLPRTINSEKQIIGPPEAKLKLLELRSQSREKFGSNAGVLMVSADLAKIGIAVSITATRSHINMQARNMHLREPEKLSCILI